ncbi:hypothetical protein Tco_1318419 [Tanacetum coccineum]
MSIPDSMMNDEIKNSAHYMTYLALSTNIEVPKVVKGKVKGLMGKKKPDADVQKEKKKDTVKKKDIVKKKDNVSRNKSLITADDNILPDPVEALKLGESMILTEAELQDEERQLHETHARLVTKKVADNAESKESEDDEVAPLIRRRTGVIIGRRIPKDRASREAYILKQIPKGSSEGSGVIPEKAESEKADEEHDDKETTDEEIANTEKADENQADEEHADEEMVDEEKIDEEKPEEEKANDEQAGAEQADDDQAKGDQAGVLIPMTWKKKPKLPKSSSSLTLSSAKYGNQFINDSSDISLVGILKDTIEPEIQSMVDVPIHQADPVVQRTPLVDTQRLLELENKVKALSKVDHVEEIEESVQANIVNQVKNQLPKLLPKVVS